MLILTAKSLQSWKSHNKVRWRSCSGCPSFSKTATVPTKSTIWYNMIRYVSHMFEPPTQVWFLMFETSLFFFSTQVGLYGLGGVSVLRPTCSMNSCVLLYHFASYTATRGITSLACHPLAGMSESMPQMADAAVQRVMQAQMPIICAWPGLDELRHFGMANDMAKPSLNRPFTPELLLQLATLKLEVFIYSWKT